MRAKLWKVIGQSIVGLDHQKNSKVCEDYVLNYNVGDVTLLVLADGASSSNHALLGAKKSCHFIKNYFIKYSLKIFNEKNKDKIKRRLISSLKRSLNYHAKQNETNIYELSSTLLFVIIFKNQYLVGHIGDGVIGVLKDNHLNVISQPENGEFANETYFTSTVNLKKHLRISEGSFNENEQVGFVLMSDGTAKSLYNSFEQTFSSGVLKLFSWMKTNNKSQMKKLLHENLKNLIRHSTNDDCSIGLLLKVK